MPRYKLLDGIKVQFTAEEEAQRDIEEAEMNAKIQELKDAETQKETDASNGKQKLKDLGLTDAEIKALIGD